MFTLPEHCKIVEGCEPQVSGAGAITGDWVSLKNYHKMWIVVHIAQGHAATTLLSPQRATDVGPLGNVAIATAIPWWTNEDLATTDLLVRGADAINFTSSATLTHKMFVCEIDPGLHGATYDCYSIIVGDSNALNLFSVMYYLLPARYAGDQPPSAIIN